MSKFWPAKQQVTKQTANIQATNQTTKQTTNNQTTKQKHKPNNKQPSTETSKRSLWSILGAYCSIQGSFWSFLARPGSVLHHFWPKQKSRARTTSNSRAQHDNRARNTHRNGARARARCPTPGGARGSRFGPCLRSHRSGRSGGAWFGK